MSSEYVMDSLGGLLPLSPLLLPAHRKREGVDSPRKSSEIKRFCANLEIP